MKILTFPAAILPAVITLCGVFYLVKLRFFFFAHPVITAKAMFSDKSSFRALSLSLAGTLGVGNIVGVSMAIRLGGAGAVFWMWASALVAAVLKYAEIVLAVKYRRKNKDGGYCGGPMYYMKDGINGAIGGILAAIFALLGVIMSFILGNLVQTGAAVSAAAHIVNVPAVCIGAALSLLCAVSLFGGYRAVSRVTSVVVPIMSGAYIVVSIKIIVSGAGELPAVFEKIFSSAFDFSAAGGGVIGFLSSAAIRHGVAKGAYSHEAGGGTAPISHAQSNAKSPARQGLLGLFEVFFDTVIICTLTALVILLYGGDANGGMDAVSAAFTHFCGGAGKYIVSISIISFAFSTLICWGYYGRACLDYLFRGKRAGIVYLAAYCAFTVAASLVGETRAWLMTDIGVSVMTAVNLIAVVALWRDVRAETELLGIGGKKRE